MRQIVTFIFLCLLIFSGGTQSSSLDSLRMVMPGGHSGPITFSTFSHNSRLIATSSMDNTVALWDVNSAQLIHQFKGNDEFLVSHNNDCKELVFNHKSSILYGAKWDNKIKSWDVKSGKLIDVYESSGENISSITISAKDDFLVCTTYDDKIDIWNLRNKKKTTISNNIKNLIGVYLSQNNQLFIV